MRSRSSTFLFTSKLFLLDGPVQDNNNSMRETTNSKWRKKTTTIKKKRNKNYHFTLNYTHKTTTASTYYYFLSSFSCFRCLWCNNSWHVTPSPAPFLTAPPPRPPSISKQSKNYYYYYLLMWKRKKTRACDDSCCCSECHHCWSINKKGLRPAVKKPQLRAGLWFLSMCKQKKSKQAKPYL